MLSRTLLPSKLHFCRLFSSSAPHVLKPGDILRQTRIFTNKDVLEYSKRSDFWEVQATNLRENNGRYLAKFKTRCFKRGELLVLEGEAVAILPTQAVEQANSAE